MDRCDCDWCVHAGQFKHVTNRPTRYRCEKEKIMECFHHATIKCRHCGEEFSVEDNAREIHSLADRVKELESKLGAAAVGLSTDREAVGERPITTSSPPAAPSVSAEWWRQREQTCLACGRPPDARSAALAAAVTDWYESDDGGDHDEADLFDIVGAFVRGEPLPQKGG